MERPTCGTCAYYDHGGCKRHPPVLVPTPQNDEILYVVRFADMEDDDFCGEHPDFGEYIMSLKEPEDAVCDVCGSHFVHGTELFCEQCERLVCEKCHEMVNKQLLCSLCIQRERS